MRCTFRIKPQRKEPKINEYKYTHAKEKKKNDRKIHNNRANVEIVRISLDLK